MRVPRRLADVHPLPVQQVVRDLPPAQADGDDLGAIDRRQEGPVLRHWSHPCVEGPEFAPDEHLEPGVQVAAEGAVVRDGHAVLGLRSHGQPHAQSESDGVAQDQDPDGVRCVRPRPLQRRMLRTTEPGREWEGRPRMPTLRLRAPCRRGTGRGTRTASRPRRAGCAPPIASRPLRPGRRRSSSSESAGLGGPLSRPQGHGRFSSPRSTQSATFWPATTRPEGPSAARTQVARSPARDSERGVEPELDVVPHPGARLHRGWASERSGHEGRRIGRVSAPEEDRRAGFGGDDHRGDSPSRQGMAHRPVLRRRTVRFRQTQSEVQPAQELEPALAVPARLATP